ncbi:MAG: LysR family transcriptional regulator [Bacteroidales bacterium]
MNKPKKDKTAAVIIHYKIWLESANGEGIMGDGKWRLLQSIDEKGSLSAAANSLGISYRKAWGDIKKAETLLGIVLIDKQRGGASGGASTLTEYGTKWLALYKSFRRKIDKIFDKEIEVFLNKLKNK